MAVFFYRVGRWAFRRRRLVGVLWVGVLLVVGFLGVRAPSSGDEALRMPGTESQQAFDLLAERFPGTNPEAAEARLVFQASDGRQVTATADKAAIEKALDTLEGSAQVDSVSDPFTSGAVSKDGTMAYSRINYTVGADDLTQEAKQTLQAAADQARDAGLTVEFGGTALLTQPQTGASTELIGLGVAAVVLFLTLGSVIAAGLPLMTALVGVLISLMGIFALARPLGLTSTVSILSLMLGLAVGIDYSLFITSRFRDERARGREPAEAAGRAVGTAGSAVVFAGATVFVALAGLSVVGVPELTKMGLASAGTVLISVVIALTLVPALFGFFGDRLLPRAVRRSLGAGRSHLRGRRSTGIGGTVANEPFAPNVAGTAAAGSSTAYGKRPGIAVRWARFLVRRRLAALLVGVIGLGVAAVPAFSLELGIPGDESKPVTNTQRRAYDLLSEGFGPGFNGPLTVVVDASQAADAQAAADTVARTVRDVDGVVSVGAPVFNPAKDTAVLTAIPASAPNTDETRDLVHHIRSAVDAVEDDTHTSIAVTGRTAVIVDVSESIYGALVIYLAVIIGFAVILLLVVFRSILVPLKAALGFLLSVGAAFGVVVAVIQWGWASSLFGIDQTGPVMSIIPIFVIGVVFGLAMDYEVFLVSRMREEYVHGATGEDAIVTGFRHSGRVVTAAAIIMISVFAGFIGIAQTNIRTTGLGMAAAVTFDAFVVRMAIVPAVLALFGDRAWKLPRMLDRVLPNVDVEGRSLDAYLSPQTTAPDKEATPNPVGGR
ncbi:MMPL family transporter [Microbispora hainanensis]|uniref:MMPL family transporter n=1 Tax=Microbispora hainanensis TaxID=568844 RepID=A0A544YLD1_9ACTN|nr:MMPL family transporter [Microbispora hainanensis]